MIETRNTIFQGGELRLKQGGSLECYQLCYNTWGTLNEEKSNVILLFHALSGSHNVTGQDPNGPTGNDFWNEESHDGWWNEFAGTGKPIDTDKYFIICFNYLGGCYGSTGPTSNNPKTGLPYGGDFPSVSISDQADVAAELIASLGIENLHAVIGPSVGGLCALTFATKYAEKVKKVALFASGYKTTVLNRLTLFEQVIAIENDPHFKAGHYYEGQTPWLGLALARMISHKTFVHLQMFEQRARKEIKSHEDILSWYKVQDPFQSYMLHQGKKFVQRFDANTYLRITDMWSRYNAVREAGCNNSEELFAKSKEHGQEFLIFSIDSDFCFYPEEQKELVDHLESSQIPVTYLTVHSDKGHDSFLLEPHLYGPQLQYFLS